MWDKGQHLSEQGATCPAGGSNDRRRGRAGGLEADASAAPAQCAVEAQKGAAAKCTLEHLGPDCQPVLLKQCSPVTQKGSLTSLARIDNKACNLAGEYA